MIASVLLVEDSPADALLISDLLATATEQTPTITRAESLGQALAQLRDRDFDAVLLDLRLPDGFGVQCVEQVHQRAPNVPIVALTGLDEERFGLDCIEAGAQDYLSKRDLDHQTLWRALAYAVTRLHERRATRRAHELRGRLAAIVETSRDAIISGRVDGVITSWNRGAEQIFGLPRERAVGVPIDVVLPAPAVADDAFRPGVDLRAPGVYEAVRLRSDNGEVVFLSVASMPLFDADGASTGFAIICHDVTEQRARAAELRRRNAQLVARDRQMRALAARLTAVREEERTRISRKVHDELGQLLTGVKLDLRWCQRRMDGAAEPDLSNVAQRLLDAEGLVDRTIETVQQVALELRPSVLDVLGLAAAIRDEGRRFAERSGLELELEVADASEMEPDTATALFRALQELLANVARHAEARVVRLQLVLADGHWCLSVHDDGIGCRPGAPSQAPGQRSGLGLLGIQERVGALGGSLSLSPRPGGGTIAEVRVPARDSVRSGDEERTDRG